LDLSTAAGAAEVGDAYEMFAQTIAASGLDMPRNHGGQDLLLRNLDRAVIEHLHTVRRDRGLPEIDAVRGFFFEGKELYPGAGFYQKTHVQICVRNADCIHGVFHVPQSDLDSRSSEQ
jgi:hypothetical protein